MLELTPNTRKPKHGWSTGFYTCRCKNCNERYVGSKHSYHCSDCAYNYDENIIYEELWANFGWESIREWVIAAVMKWR